MLIPSSERRTLIAAITIILSAALGASDPAFAQQDPSSRRAESEVAFNLPAQALATALARFSEETNLQLVYETRLAAGKQAPALVGRFAPQDALTRLLAGSGLAFRFTDAKTIVIQQARAAGSSRVLGPVRVEGATLGQTAGVNGSSDPTATEGTGSMTTGAMTIGSKSPRAIKDTAQSVSVITSEQLQQQNISDFTRALQQAPGISFAQGPSSLETTFYSRGYAITSIQVDGGAPLTTSFGNLSTSYYPQIDLSQYDHVEVLRGAAGLFNGYGQASGTINLVRKKPLDHQQVTVEAEAGSWNHRRAVVDATASLGFDGALRGRAVVTWQSNEYFYEVAEDEKTLIYGVLEYDLTPTTLLTTGISQANQHSVPWISGLPRFQTGADLHLPRETALIFPWNRWDFDTTEIFGSIEQGIGEDWRAKLNLTSNRQASTRKAGSTGEAVNPIDNRGPRLNGQYSDFASDQLAAETTLSGAFTLFGQRQEVTFGANYADQDGGGRVQYGALVAGTADAPYQPYPGGPLYCQSVTGAPLAACPTGVGSPPINVFDFNPYDPIYTEPRNTLPNARFPEQGQEQTVLYVTVRLTALDRLHLETGLRWSRYELKSSQEQLCTSIPVSGTPRADNCVGRQIGDPYRPQRNARTGEEFSWPPTLALSYDVTNSLITYLGYADIYQDRSYALDRDLQPLGPVVGGNVELGFKWAPRDRGLNATLAFYRSETKGFPQQDPSVPPYNVDADHECCFFQRKDQTDVSDGIDTEVTGELLPGWQVSTSYTFSRTQLEGAGYGTREGVPFQSIQPEHLYKLWTTYDFGASGVAGWLSNLTLSAGVNGQSEGYRSGQACPAGQVGPPQPNGTARCLVAQVPFQFTVEPYAVFSGRIGYRLNEKWTAAVHLENIFDKTYYQSVGSGVSNGNWYGAPRSFMLTVRGSL